MVLSHYFRLAVRTYSSFRVFSVTETLTLKPINSTLLVQGWVQSVRKHKNVYFVDVIDGSCFERLQVVIEEDACGIPAYGSSVKFEGQLIKSDHKGQEVELICKTWQTVGKLSEGYPFESRTIYSPEYIRQFPHLRPKTKVFGSVLRVRSYASQAVHDFFLKNGFHLIHVPVITRNDCEGAGEVFVVQSNKKCEVLPEESIDQNEKQSNSNASSPTTNEKNSTSENLGKKSFFGSPAYLTVSGQFHLEAMASALSRVYSFSPVFRAENTHTRQHASEFYMIEAEMAFLENLHLLEEKVEQLIKHIAQLLVTNCRSEIECICQKNDNRIHSKYVDKLISSKFVHMTYSEAVSVLQNSKKQFLTGMKYGDDFTAEHKNYLSKYCDGIPVFLTMFPSSIKPFYMKSDSDGMALCFDVIAPYGGEICGGSLRENSESILAQRLQSLNLEDSLSWYLDLRKYGSVPTGGFGIGFDRLLQSILGLPNIRDVIPFPRRSNDCRC